MISRDAVIDAFIGRQPAKSNQWHTDGVSLYCYTDTEVARWNGDVLTVLPADRGVSTLFSYLAQAWSSDDGRVWHRQDGNPRFVSEHPLPAGLTIRRVSA